MQRCPYSLLGALIFGATAFALPATASPELGDAGIQCAALIPLPPSSPWKRRSRPTPAPSATPAPAGTTAPSASPVPGASPVPRVSPSAAPRPSVGGSPAPDTGEEIDLEAL